MATLNKSMKAMKTNAYHDNSLEIPVIKIQNQQTSTFFILQFLKF